MQEIMTLHLPVDQMPIYFQMWKCCHRGKGRISRRVPERDKKRENKVIGKPGGYIAREPTAGVIAWALFLTR